jgi:uncharacterized membrane protein
MNVRKVVTGSILAAGLGVAGLFGAGPAFADVTNNPTTNDAHGFGIANHIANFNGDHNGIGWIRSEQTGAQISAGGGADGAYAADPNTVLGQGNPDSRFAPISSAGGKDGNKVVPQTKAKP